MFPAVGTEYATWTVSPAATEIWSASQRFTRISSSFIPTGTGPSFGSPLGEIAVMNEYGVDFPFSDESLSTR